MFSLATASLKSFGDKTAHLFGKKKDDAEEITDETIAASLKNSEELFKQTADAVEDKSVDKADKSIYKAAEGVDCAKTSIHNALE